MDQQLHQMQPRGRTLPSVQILRTVILVTKIFAGTTSGRRRNRDPGTAHSTSQKVPGQAHGGYLPDR